jgi:hypothetical protein
VLNFKPDLFKGKHGYMNELTMNSIPSIGMHYFLTWRMLMKCVIPSPRHSSESHGSAFQPKWSLYVLAIDHGLIVNSEEKLEKETIFVRQQNNLTNNQISTNTRNKETKSIILKRLLKNFSNKI